MSKTIVTGNPTNSNTDSGVRNNVARPAKAYIKKLLAGQFENEKKIQNRKKYKGMILHTKRIKTEDFVEKFPEDFAAYVLKTKNVDADAIRNNPIVYEVIVFILEVSGCLPFPDMTVIEEKFDQLKNEQNNIEDLDWDKLSDKRKGKEWSEFSKALTRLDRFPRFYTAKRNSSSDHPDLSRYSTAMVEFLDDDDWSTSGILLGTGL